jgi:hypothetical protein
MVGMKASTPIARLVETMLSDGIAHDAIVRAVESAEAPCSRPSSRTRIVKGTRLSPDWAPSVGLVSYGVAQGLTPTLVQLEAEKFKNYWLAKSGPGAVKRDWDATWRNWVLTTVERRYAGDSGSRAAFGRTSAAGSRSTGSDAVIAGMGRLAHRRAANRTAAGPADGKMETRANPTGELDLDGGGA